MSIYKRFEDLPVWQQAERLYGAVLDLLEGGSRGLSIGFRNQLDRAALSVSNNIAEGFERMSTAELLFLFRDGSWFRRGGSIDGHRHPTKTQIAAAFHGARRN
ncbi:MAG: four helix bundle protein [Verrucomicrobia bacterium]|nr:four helix bundle protein [Verrucomicrobiota bacterium]